MSRIETLLNLNEEQKSILSDEARIAIEAGAGSGKTRSLVAKYLHVLENREASVDQIVAITFTNNAARELRSKIHTNIRSYIDNYGERGNINKESLRRLSNSPISTIHGFCSRILRENPYDSKISPAFSLIDEIEKEKFYENHIRNFVLKCVGDKREDIMELLRYEGYDHNELISIISFILNRSSLLHVETPFPVFKNNTEKNHTGGIDPDIPEELITNFTSLLTNRSRTRIDGITESYRKLDPSKAITGNIDHIISIHEHASRPLSDEDTEKARKELHEYVDNIINCFNHHMSKLYLELSNEAYQYVQDRKLENHILDFEDQIRYSYSLLKNNPGILEHYRDRFRYIIVDEFQDTDDLQYRLLSLITRGNNNRLVVVGDKKQSIYSFRGGEPAIFENVLGDPEYRNYTLKSNYRSTSYLISYFNSFFLSVFSDSYDCMDFKSGDSGESPDIDVIMTLGEGLGDARYKEAAIVCDKVTELITSGNYRDIALLFRNSTHALEYERELKQRNISFDSDFGYGFYRKHEIRDLISMLKFFVDPQEELSKVCVLRSPFYGASDELIYRYMTSDDRENDNGTGGIRTYLDFLLKCRESVMSRHPLSVVNFIMHDLGYCGSLAGLEDGKLKLLNTWKFYNICESLVNKGKGLVDIINYFDDAMFSGNEIQPGDHQQDDVRIRLTTVHRSKGLEYDAVILCDTNYTPKHNTGRVAGDAIRGFFVRYGNTRSSSWEELKEYQKLKDEEDEKRLLYVAKTRARKKLVIALSSKSGKKKKHQYSKQSFARFIQDELGIPEVDPPESLEYKGLNLYRYNGLDEGVRYMPEDKIDTGEFRFGAKYIEKLYEEDKSDGSELITGPGFSDSKEGRDDPVVAGDLLHRFFEIWDFDPENIEKVAVFVQNESFISGNGFTPMLRNAAHNFLGSKLYEIISGAERIHREYGFVIEFPEKIERGRIDLLIETTEGVILVDYKYRKSEDVEKFGDQLSLYSRAVETKYGAPPLASYIVTLPDINMINILGEQ